MVAARSAADGTADVNTCTHTDKGDADVLGRSLRQRFVDIARIAGRDKAAHNKQLARRMRRDRPIAFEMRACCAMLSPEQTQGRGLHT